MNINPEFRTESAGWTVWGDVKFEPDPDSGEVMSWHEEALALPIPSGHIEFNLEFDVPELMKLFPELNQQKHDGP